MSSQSSGSDAIMEPSANRPLNGIETNDLQEVDEVAGTKPEDLNSAEELSASCEEESLHLFLEDSHKTIDDSNLESDSFYSTEDSVLPNCDETTIEVGTKSVGGAEIANVQLGEATNAENFCCKNIQEVSRKDNKTEESDKIEYEGAVDTKNTTEDQNSEMDQSKDVTDEPSEDDFDAKEQTVVEEVDAVVAANDQNCEMADIDAEVVTGNEDNLLKEICPEAGIPELIANSIIDFVIESIIDSKENFETESPDEKNEARGAFEMAKDDIGQVVDKVIELTSVQVSGHSHDDHLDEGTQFLSEDSCQVPDPIELESGVRQDADSFKFVSHEDEEEMSKRAEAAVSGSDQSLMDVEDVKQTDELLTPSVPCFVLQPRESDEDVTTLMSSMKESDGNVDIVTPSVDMMPNSDEHVETRQIVSRIVGDVLKLVVAKLLDSKELPLTDSEQPKTNSILVQTAEALKDISKLASDDDRDAPLASNNNATINDSDTFKEHNHEISVDVDVGNVDQTDASGLNESYFATAFPSAPNNTIADETLGVHAEHNYDPADHGDQVDEKVKAKPLVNHEIDRLERTSGKKLRSVEIPSDLQTSDFEVAENKGLKKDKLPPEETGTEETETPTSNNDEKIVEGSSSPLDQICHNEVRSMDTEHEEDEITEKEDKCSSESKEIESLPLGDNSKPAKKSSPGHKLKLRSVDTLLCTSPSNSEQQVKDKLFLAALIVCGRRPKT